MFVRLYPGPLSQVVEGMDAILRMPVGCFEQTSSTTYPNVLALDYMKRTKKLTPEVHAKAEGFIANGYQRLLTFEVPGRRILVVRQCARQQDSDVLRADGVLRYVARCMTWIRRLIERTQQWLAGAAAAGRKLEAGRELHQRRRHQSLQQRRAADHGVPRRGRWRIPAIKGPAVEKAKEYVAAHLNGKVGRVHAGGGGQLRGRIREGPRVHAPGDRSMLLDARTEKDEQAWWTAEETGVYGRGESAAVETTGLAVQALLKWGEASVTASKALHYIAAKKDAAGTWGTTQATIMALRALLLWGNSPQLWEPASGWPCTPAVSRATCSSA